MYFHAVIFKVFYAILALFFSSVMVYKFIEFIKTSGKARGVDSPVRGGFRLNVKRILEVV